MTVFAVLARTRALEAAGVSLLLFTLVSVPAQQPATGGVSSPAVLLGDESLVFEQKSVALLANSGEVRQIALSPDRKTLAAATGGPGDKPGDLRLWDITAGKEKAAVKERSAVRAVAYSPDGEQLATGEEDHTAKLRDPESGKVRTVLRGHHGPVTAVGFTSESRTLITASLDRAVKFWDAETGKEKASATEHSDGILGMAISHDGKTLATASRDGTAKLWDLETKKVKRTLKGHASFVMAVAFS